MIIVMMIIKAYCHDTGFSIIAQVYCMEECYNVQLEKQAK